MYRPIKFRSGWTKAILDEIIKDVEEYLYRFAQTRAFDSGIRLSETEAYLTGLKDAKKLKQQP